MPAHEAGLELDPRLWPRLEELFHGALAFAGEPRARYLERSCAGDAELERRLARLLAAHERAASGFLDPPEMPSLAGRELGGCRLIRLLGSGGMGAVYEAEQQSPRRRVALKVVRALPGSERDAARLGDEAEIMARLRHPNVAQIHAAGVLDDPAGGLAWFAMELVPEAQSLVAYARARGLDLRARLELFAAACDGVQHGHQRGVVHLDLKPENVLVDGRGNPKVIDFGIARATGGGSLRTLRAGPGEIAGTLAYMSPEQLDDSAGSIGTHSDVYALGAILYELLAGARPLELEGRSLAQCAALVRGAEPLPLSRRRRGIDRDLAALAAKALAKDPAQRYPTAGALADDLRRHLRHEPVLARPPSLAYQLGLLARRHRAAALALSSVAAVLLAATAVSIAFAVREQRAAEEERLARLRADRVSGLLGGILSAASPSVASAREVTARELVDQIAFQAERTLADDPAGQSEVLATLASTYYALGRLEQAESLAADALEAAERCGDSHRAAGARSTLGTILAARGRVSEAEELLQRALAEQRAPGFPSASLANTLYRLGLLQRTTGRAEAARATLEEALAACRREPGQVDNVEPSVLTALGQIASDERDWERAEEFQRAALALQERRVPAGHVDIAAAENSLANTLFERGRNAEALELWTRALATFEAVLEPAHPDRAAVLTNLALAHQRQRDWTRAGELHRRAIELRRAALGPEHAKVAHSLGQYASMQLDAGDLDGAVETAREALAVARRAHAGGGAAQTLHNVLTILALVEQRRDELGPAEEHLREVLASQRSTLSARHPDLAQSLTLLGALLLARGEPAPALEILDEALSIRRERLGDHWLVANTQSLYGEALCGLGRIAEAEPLLIGAYERLRASLGAADFRARDGAERIAALYERKGQPEQAASWRAGEP